MITGGGTGIGAATALLFAQHGADVVLASRKTENLERIAARGRGRDGTAGARRRHRRARRRAVRAPHRRVARRARPCRRAREQRGREPLVRVRGLERRSLPEHDRPQPQERVRALAAGRTPHGRARQRLDHQHLVGRRGVGAADPHRVRGGEGRAREPHPELRRRARAARHPRELRARRRHQVGGLHPGHGRGRHRPRRDGRPRRRPRPRRRARRDRLADPVLRLGGVELLLGPDPLRRAAARRTSPLDGDDRSASSASRTTT